MKKIGMIVAVEIEAVLQNMGCDSSGVEKRAGYNIYHYKIKENDIYVLDCGAGEIAAAAGTQFLITAYAVDIVVNFGVVGGLTDEMTTTSMCIVEKVVHYDFDTSAVDNISVGRYLQYPDIYIPTTSIYVKQVQEIYKDIVPVICASGDKFIADSMKKKKLNQVFNADICEMEAAGIVLTCNRNEVPCLILKCVSDSVSGGAEEFGEFIKKSAEICFKVTMKIIESIV